MAGLIVTLIYVLVACIGAVCGFLVSSSLFKD